MQGAPGTDMPGTSEANHDELERQALPNVNLCLGLSETRHKVNFPVDLSMLAECLMGKFREQNLTPRSISLNADPSLAVGNTGRIIYTGFQLRYIHKKVRWFPEQGDPPKVQAIYYCILP